VAHIREQEGDAHAIPMDVTDGDSVAAGFKQCLDISPVTVLVNNAGLAGESMLLSMPEEEWDSVVNTNLKGAWLVARAAAQQMIDHDRSGAIINIASVLGSSRQNPVSCTSPGQWPWNGRAMASGSTLLRPVTTAPIWRRVTWTPLSGSNYSSAFHKGGWVLLLRWTAQS